MTRIWNELQLKLFHQKLTLNKGLLNNLSGDLLITDPGAMCSRKKKPNSAEGNYSFHGRLKGDSASILTNLDSPMPIFYFGYLEGVNWVKLDQKVKFWVRPVSVKIPVFQNDSNSICTTIRSTCGQTFSSIWHFLQKLLPQKPKKCAQLGPKPKKNIFISSG